MSILNDVDLDTLTKTIDEDYLNSNGWHKFTMAMGWWKYFQKNQHQSHCCRNEKISVLYSFTNKTLINLSNGEKFQTDDISIIEHCIDIWKDGKNIY